MTSGTGGGVEDPASPRRPRQAVRTAAPAALPWLPISGTLVCTNDEGKIVGGNDRTDMPFSGEAIER
ncbi:hypothetical protein ACFOWZ_05475 [Lentzea rhizosphaerae]|uniref:Uncharacterized protein n=1 Tax=Lentzea rhizosphaerae TaxID=2041025 RepID=A0ABV8BNE2_9PSEU